MECVSCSICFEDLLAASKLSEVDEKGEGTPSAPPAEDEFRIHTTKSLEVCATPCGHVFHRSCVSRWVDEHRDCPQCRQKVISSTRLVTLYFAKERVNGSSPRPTNLAISGPSSSRFSPQRSASLMALTTDLKTPEETRIIVDVMQCQLEDLEQECQKLRKSLIFTEEELQTTVSELSALQAAREGQLDASNFVRDLAEIRQEHEALQSTSQELQREMNRLRDSIESKDNQIRERDRAYQCLMERNSELVAEVSDVLRSNEELRVSSSTNESSSSWR